MPPLRDIVVGFAFYIGLRGPGRVPVFSPGVRPLSPSIPLRSMLAATFSLPSILLLRLVPCGLLQWEDRYQFMTVAPNPPVQKTSAWPSGLVSCNRRGELSEGSGF